MSDAKQGLRGTADYPANQRPTNFGGSIKLKGRRGLRVTLDDVKRVLKKRKRRK